MAKSKLLKKLSRYAKKKVFSPAGMRTSIIAGGATAGYAAGFSRSEPGLRKQGAKEGAIGGAVIGGALAFSPSIARFAGRTAKTEAKRAGRRAKVGVKKRYKKIKGFFRRGGRVRPIFE